MWGRRLLRALAIAVVLAVAHPAAAQGVDGGWPREIRQDGDVLRYYQPQVDGWDDQKLLRMRLAVVVSGPAFKTPVAGALWLEARTDTDVGTRTVHLTDLKVERVLFALTDKALADRAEETLRRLIPPGPIVVALDRVLAGVKAAAAPRRAPALKNDPPMIIVSRQPARLVVFDGQPVFAPIGNTGLQYAINTNWTFVNVIASAEYYLLDDRTWLAASDIAGPWSVADRLASGFLDLPDDDNWKDARAAAAAMQAQYRQAPRVHVVTQPAEMVVIDGEPKLAPAGKPGGPLSYVANTDADLFFHKTDNNWYLLVAGRWFRAITLQGPWTYATRDLPKAFADIPANGRKGRALYSVPGTPQAQQAVLVAGIPQAAVLKRSEAILTVSYGGEPRFAAIEGTLLSYAVNASTVVIKVADGVFYALERGAWFVAASPAGPWALAKSVPPEIYGIPPGSPVYNAIYVTQEAVSEDEVVSSYTDGYLGGYVYDDVLMWGTGYYYPPYWYYGALPVYYPCPYTWGAAAWYNPATNTYFRGGAVYGPYGGFGAAAAYNAATGTYARGAAAYGPYGGFKVGAAYNPATGAWARGAAGYGPNGAWRGGYGYNPATGTHIAAAQGSSVYGSWGKAAVSRGDQWARAGYRSTSEGTIAGVRTSQGTGAIIGQGAGGNTAGVIRGQNNTYVGGDGNVYRRNDQGWSKYENGSWNPVTPPQRGQAEQQPGATRLAGSGSSQLRQPGGLSGAQSPQQRFQDAQRTMERSTYDSLDQERLARQQGAQRANNWESEFRARSGYGGYGGASNFQAGRPYTGGAMRGGGGFRGGRR